MGYSQFLPRGLTHADLDRTCRGYVLFSPMSGQFTHLLNREGHLVHTWHLPRSVRAYWGDLTADGNLLIGCVSGKERWRLGGSRACILELGWDSEVVWSYEDASLHHDHCRLANGNTVVVGRRVVSPDIASRVRGGLPGTGLSDGTMICDYLREVTPTGRAVWEWHADDALDPDLDLICPLEARVEWSHCNAIEPLEGDQLLLSFRNTSSVVIFDPGSEQFVWRLKGGLTSHQHAPLLLGNGNVLIFDNGEHREIGPPRSRVVEVHRPSQGTVWEYNGVPEDSFFSARIGGAQRLPNDNTLVCEGRSGRIFEVTMTGEIVWEYLNPYAFPHLNEPISWSVFRARHYPEDAPELASRLRS